MTANGNVNGGGYWRYLIRDRNATPQLRDLCLGLAKIIRDLEPGPDNELTPQRLAAFYRQTGSNYDSTFLKTGDSGISWMFRTLGCLHSLQPNIQNAFESPSQPCLTDEGFARWQTLQLLLCPEDSVRSLTKAVEIFDVVRPDGGYFPKHIPRDCFPSRPDPEMEKWYEHVVGRINQDRYVKRIQNSPYQSPHPERDRKDGYFAQNGRLKPSRQNSHDNEAARIAEYRRRSSVPDIVSPLPQGAERGSHWDPAAKHEQERKARSHSAQRPTNHTRQRSSTNPSAPYHHSKHKSDHSPSDRRHGSNPDHIHTTSRPPSSYSQHSHHQRPYPKSPSTVDENSGSEASSENSHVGRRPERPPHRKEEERQSRRSSLWPPNIFKSHKRRHSSEPRKIEDKPPTPLRPEYYPPKHAKHGPPPPQVVLQSPYRPPQNPGVKFRDDMFQANGVNPASGLSAAFAPAQPPYGMPPPVIRYPEQSRPPYPVQQMDGMTVGETIRRESSSGSGTDWDRNQQRKAGAPLRVATVSGTGGRKYPIGAEMNPGDRDRQHARVRGSLPTPV